MNVLHAINTTSNKLTGLFTSSHLNHFFGGRDSFETVVDLLKRVKFELEDERGRRSFHIVEGPVSRNDLMKTMDALELMDQSLEHTPHAPDEGTFFGKVQTLLETSFAAGDFSSSDMAREFEDKYSQPVKLSTISTYLARLVDKQYVKRERFGNSWVYRRVYLKPTQVAER